MRVTLRTAKQACLKASNLVLTDTRLVDIINEAERRLLDRGRWWGTYGRIAITASEGLITWPREVETIEAVALCNNPYPVKNGWWEYIEAADGLRPLTGSPVALVDRGNVALESEISGTGKKLRAYAGHPSDSGKLIHFKGTTSDGKRIKSEYPAASETYIDGFWLTLTGWLRAVDGTPLLAGDGSHLLAVQDYAESDAEVYTIDFAEKEATAYPVEIREYDTTTGAELILASYLANETIINRRRSLIDPLLSSSGSDTTCTSTTRTVTALVKFAHVDAVVDNDYLVIQSLEALQLAVRSIRLEESNEWEQSKKFFNSAIVALNHQLRTQTGSRTNVSVKVHGSAPLYRARIGSLT